MKLSTKAKTFLRVFISVALISYLIYSQDLTKIKEAVLNFNPLYLLAALIIRIISLYFSASRWKIILETSKVKVKTRDLYILYMRGYFYNNFLPTQMGGDVYKSIAIGNKIKNQSTALFSVFLDRFSGLLILLVMSLFGVSTLFGNTGIFIGAGLFIIGLLLYFPVLNFFSSKIKFLKKFKEASELFVKNKKKAAYVLIYSAIIQALSFSIVYVLFMGLGIYLPLWSVIAYMPLTSLSLLIPSMNGIGTQETVYAFLFKGAGVTGPLSITVSIMIHVVRLTMSLIGGVSMLLGEKKK